MRGTPHIKPTTHLLQPDEELTLLRLAANLSAEIAEYKKSQSPWRTKTLDEAQRALEAALANVRERYRHIYGPKKKRAA